MLACARPNSESPRPNSPKRRREYRATVPRPASSYLDVVTAQRTARLAIALHTRQLVAEIGLMLALGGGGIVPPEPPAKPGFAPYLAE